MSVKIYSGFRIFGGLHRAYTQLEALRPAIQEMSYERYVKLLVTCATNLIDSHEQSGKPLEKGPVFTAMKIFDEREKKIKDTDLRDPAADFEFRVSLYPVTTQSTLGIPWIGWYEWSRWFEALPFVYEYGYWDTTDRPDGVDRKEWAKRKEHWGIACLDLGKTFSSTGLEMDLMGGYPPKIRFLANQDRWSDILKHVPSNESRARDWLYREGIKHDEVTPEKLQSIALALPSITEDKLKGE